MASDETMTIRSSMQEEDCDYDIDFGFVHPHQLNLSRLSVCSTNSVIDFNDDDGIEKSYAADEDGGMRTFMSGLSIESFDGDADEELSDEKDSGKGRGAALSSDSEKEAGYYSLPATPPRSRRRNVMNRPGIGIGDKDYASENEVQKGSRRRRRSTIVRGRKDLEGSNNWDCCSNMKTAGKEMTMMGNRNNSYSGGESESGGVLVITRPKGGRRTLCMDMEEVKACRDLGFELEHERMLEIPSRVSVSGSTLDTSSGGNSPIANWRISSPGDDPKDVKARLKVWAQAVAIASTSRPTS